VKLTTALFILAAFVGALHTWFVSLPTGLEKRKCILIPVDQDTGGRDVRRLGGIIAAGDGYYDSDMNGTSRQKMKASTYDVAPGNCHALMCDERSSRASGVMVSVKIYLDGPYNTGGMEARLIGTDSNKVLIPLTHPYSSIHNGDENIVSRSWFLSHDNIVDWVLIELRENQTGPVIDSRAAFLLTSGNVVDIDGSGPVSFPNANPDQYHLAVRHRNHLGVVSHGKIPLSISSAEYDFSSALAQAWNNGPSPAMIDLGNGVYGLWSGDANGDGSIDGNDYDSYKTSQGNTGYINTDATMDGSVDAIDYTRIKKHAGMVEYLQ
jgi:hypothetical protein